MKLSLIVPVYNEEAYLRPFFDSIINQSRILDEIIVCDNNSTDNSINIVKKYSKKLPIKLVHESKKGITYAVETAWRAASGDIIFKTDADCVLPKNWIKNHLKYYQQNPEIVACGGGFFASDGNLISKLLTPFLCGLNHIFLHLAHGHRVLYGGNMSIKKTTLEKIKGYRNNHKKIQDDILISKKLFKNNCRYGYYSDLGNYTSLRRYQSLKDLIFTVLSIFNPKFYREKST